MKTVQADLNEARDCLIQATNVLQERCAEFIDNRIGLRRLTEAVNAVHACEELYTHTTIAFDTRLSKMCATKMDFNNHPLRERTLVNRFQRALEPMTGH